MSTVSRLRVLSVLAVAACAGGTDGSAANSGGAAGSADFPSNGQTHVETSLAYANRSLSDLKNNADLGVLGHVQGVTDDMTGPITEQWIELSVDEVLWRRDPNEAAPQTVQFEHTPVGDFGSRLTVGQEHIIFFEEWSPAHYRESGGPTGCFDVSAGVVTPLDSYGVELPVGTDVAGFKTMFEAAADPKAP